MTRKKILSGITIAAITAILLAWAPSTVYGIQFEKLDIKPGSCPNPINLRSNGLVPIAILGSDTFDVNDIDLSSFPPEWRPTIEDVATPFDGEFVDRFSCTEEGPDGFDDLILKSPIGAFVILCSFSDDTTILLALDFLLNDGTFVIVLEVVNTIIKNKACV